MEAIIRIVLYVLAVDHLSFFWLVHIYWHPLHFPICAKISCKHICMVYTFRTCDNLILHSYGLVTLNIIHDCAFSGQSQIPEEV